MSAGDTAWVLMSAALVLLMTPALAFFYGGLVRRKNVLSVLMQCFMLTCLITVQWVLFGYSLSFGPDVHGVIGSLAWFGLRDVTTAPNATYAATIPHQAFMIYQAMFAVITPALILGAFAERMKFGPFCLFSLLWATLVYDPICHWVWGDGGFLKAAGVLDFAGGIVVHVSAGMAALAAALVMGKRIGYPNKISPPHNLPFAVLGAGMLWFGWFGFNAGSALSAGSIATTAFVSTHCAGAAAGLTWCLLDWIFNSRATMLGMITGAIAGLAAVTPASGYVNPIGALWIGIGASAVCFAFVALLKPRLGYDDSLDAFGVHGIGGIWGSLALGLWGTKLVNPSGMNGLFYHDAGSFLIQLKGVVITGVYSFVVSVVLLKLVDMFVGLRTNEHEERVGLDLIEHRESAYTLID
ncbi:TPA: ammonia channel protein [Candidatus Sumerlaeota bacterium]|nr:ammonia channel protein [Candidatus Sumerlaeota bacterium]